MSSKHQHPLKAKQAIHEMTPSRITYDSAYCESSGRRHQNNFVVLETAKWHQVSRLAAIALFCLNNNRTPCPHHGQEVLLEAIFLVRPRVVTFHLILQDPQKTSKWKKPPFAPRSYQKCRHFQHLVLLKAIFQDTEAYFRWILLAIHLRQAS